MEMTLENLIEAIRGADSLEELKCMVGPSQEENEAAKNRLARMDAISPACQWDSMAPDWKAQQARENYRRIEREQGAFEAVYC